MADAVVALTYYTPYVSGLTEVARVIAVEMASAGMSVTVVTTRHRADLPAEEMLDGVRVVRCPVVGRVSKGTLSPAFPLRVAREARRARLLHLHLPMIEAGVIAQLVPRRVPLVTTYHCDVVLPGARLGRGIVASLDASSRLAIRRSRAVVVSSQDYARSSRVSRSLARVRTVEIPPPCIDRRGGRPRLRDGDGLHVGFLGRIVEEKGVEHLVAGFRALPGADARLLIGGEYEEVAGGSVVDRVRGAAASDPRIRLLGFVPEADLADFYASLDVFALPSVNPLEAFGIVQVEAMLAGVPVIASDLPGVRQPVTRTGFGVIVPPGDAAAITRALQQLAVSRPPREGALRAREAYSVDASVAAYSQLYAELRGDAQPM